MPAGPLIGAIGAVGSVVGGLSSRKSASKQQSAAEAQLANPTNAPQVDIPALDAQVREIARKNAIDSLALEKQLTPEVSQLRTQSIQSLLGDLGPTAADPYSDTLRASLMDQFNATPYSPNVQRSDLSNAAYDRIAGDLALGGALPQDVRNAILRRSAATSGRVGGGALDLAHDIGARDLGLSSLDLLNSRVSNAVNAGGLADQFSLSKAAQEQAAAQNALQQRLQAAGLITDIGTNQANLANQAANRRLAIANLGQSIASPVVGLDPGSVASVAIGNQNALQAYLQNQQQIATAAANAKNQATGNLISSIPSALGGLWGAIGGAGNLGFGGGGGG